jgi:hypothetical protein
VNDDANVRAHNTCRAINSLCSGSFQPRHELMGGAQGLLPKVGCLEFSCYVYILCNFSFSLLIVSVLHRYIMLTRITGNLLWRGFVLNIGGKRS